MAGPNRPASRLKNRKQTTQQRKGKLDSGNESTDVGNLKAEEDEALLRPPLSTSVTGLLQAIKVLNTAPKDVRDFLANECDIIYECKICRGLFRSIANFISHKRSYCTNSYLQVYHLKKKDEDQGFMIQSDKEIKEEEESSSNEKSKKLSSIVEYLAKKKSLTLVSRETKKNGSDISNTDNQILNLEAINGNESVVFQSLNLTSEDDDLMKTEIMELHMMEDDESAVIGADGNCLGFRNGSINDEPTSENTSSDNCLTCSHCGHKFSTRKTLKFHVLSKHNESRLVFSCTDCPEMFVNPWGVYRHLFKVHRRTTQEIRKLRETIQQNSHRIDQPPANKKNRSTEQSTNVTVKLTEQQRLDEENKAWMDNLESDNDFQCCGGCGRRFERKAALHSHSLMCQKRIAARNTFNSTKGKQKVLQTEDKLHKQTKCSNKRKPIKKKNQSPEKNDNGTITSDISRPPSETGQPSLSRRGSVDTPLNLPISDEESLQEVPMKDPLEVSDSEEMPTLVKENITSSFTENITLKDISCENSLTSAPILSEKYDSENKNTVSVEHSPLKKSPIKETVSIAANTEQKLKVINDMLSTRIKAFTSVGKKFVCMPCDYRYSSLASLRRHMAVHFNWKRFRCLRCDFMSYDKREIIVHAQTVHQAVLANIKKFIARMPESESDTYSSKVFLPLNTTPQEIITLDDSDDDSTKQLPETTSKDDCEDKDDDLSQTNSNNSNNGNDNELSRKLIVEMILGGSESDQPVSSFTKDQTVDTATADTCTTIELSATSSDNSNSPSKDDSPSKNENNQIPNLPILSSRPVRNRVKPVNKDFIYDMSSLTKDDTSKDYGFTKSTKRKSDFFDNGKEGEKSHHSKTDLNFEINTKKKRRRNSKVFLVNSNSNSNSNELITDSVKIVPIVCNSTTESSTKTEKKNYEKETESDNSDYSDCKNIISSSDTDTSPVKSDISEDSILILQSTVST